MPNEYMLRGITGQRAAVKPLEGIIEGYPIVFNQRTQIGNYFFEEIDPHALDEADLSDIKFLINVACRKTPPGKTLDNGYIG